MPGARRLAVFDLDGTLLDSRVMDTSACFFPALRAVTGLEGSGVEWEAYAEAAVKIESAELPLDGVPLATSSDRMARPEILALAVERASSRYGVPVWERVVYVGDGVWDVTAARACGIAFGGVGEGNEAAKLSAAGARVVLPDFRDLAAVDSALEAATVPKG
ncbi:MAG: hypothetical protein AAB368_09580 [bacterium]